MAVPVESTSQPARPASLPGALPASPSPAQKLVSPAGQALGPRESVLPETFEDEKPRSNRVWLHFALIFSLGVCLVIWLSGALALDVFSPEPTPLVAPQVTPLPDVSGPPPTAAPAQRALKIGLTTEGRFGLIAQGPGLPVSVQNKFLTYSQAGETSNTRLWIDGQTPIFGRGGQLGPFELQPDGSSRVTWETGRVRVTQVLETVIGPSGLGDTLRIQYDIANLDTQEHQVGLRIMADTLIGGNDGVPFLIPGREGITDRAVDLTGAEIPDAIRALEIADLVNPGVIVNLTLSGADATLPDRVLITGWYDADMEWDFLQKAGGEGAPLKRGGLDRETPDSAVGLFFNPQALAPGASRTVVTYYGLGSISSTSSGNRKLGLFAPSSVSEGERFYLTAVVMNPASGETVTLVLPENLALAPGETATRVLSESSAGFTQVSWLLQACKRTDGSPLQVHLEPGSVTETWNLEIEPVGITRPGGACP